MLQLLIGSKTRVALLTLFLLNPGEKYYIREISRKLGIGVDPLRKELSNLEGIGLLKSERVGNQKHYRVDETYFLYDELQKLVLKTEGIAKVLTEEFAGSDAIEILFVYGSFAAGKAHERSDIDLFVVGNISDDDLIVKITEMELVLGREINYTLLRREELLQRMSRKDPFITNVVREPKIFIRGQHGFEDLGKSGKDKENPRGPEVSQ
ncbi:MAG: nucleotidyltransferase domain-containing protein [Methanolinea sp.]|nr:nucleotidyltransferase domain-containing protein [Methanolinea sp.]